MITKKLHKHTKNNKTNKLKPKKSIDLFYDFPLSFDSPNDCNNSKHLTFITHPKDFYDLIPDNIQFNKPIKKSRKKVKELKFEIYQQLNKESILNSFNYLFHHIRMGIFVYIKDNTLFHFVPFQNMNYRNNWSHLISFDNDLSNSEYANQKQSYTRKKDTIEKNIKKWSSNNCLIGNWTDNEVGDMGWYELRDMIHQTCISNTINDCVFFINRRDHPVLTPQRTEPYFHIFGNLTTPLSRHKYDKYAPILSFSKNDDFADILIPNYADWRNITKQFYPSLCSNMEQDTVNSNWNKKIPKAVFRGSATGCGVTPETNQRVKLAQISKSSTDLMDAGLVGLNLRDKKFIGEPVNFLRYKDLNLKMSKRISMNEQSNFKYIIHIDGHVSAYRLGKELSLGSTLLKVDSLYNYKLWFSDLLKSKIHYVPVKKDLKNIEKQILWCQNNDKECKKIADNAKELYDNIMTKKNVFCYLSHIFNSISHNYEI
jgi:hypothetical protein